MPYFIYRIDQPLALTHIGTEEKYKDARALVRKQRQDQPSGDTAEFRMVFTKSPGEAERLLSTPRDERVIGED